MTPKRLAPDGGSSLPVATSGCCSRYNKASWAGIATDSLKFPAGLKVSFPAWNSNAYKLTVGQSLRLEATCHGLSDDGTTVRIRGVVLPEAKTQLPIEK